MSLNDETRQQAVIDFLWAKLRQLEAELALYEPVTVSAASQPHTLNVRRADNSTDWVENGIRLYVKAES